MTQEATEYKYHIPDGPKTFHLMPKPSGSQCNLDCQYCYYLSKEELLEQPKVPRMSDEVLESYIKQYLRDNTGPEVIFTWQGGEPTLMGLDFFKKAIALQKKYARYGQKVLNDLQTNGTLLTEEWAIFLKKHDFLVGLSIDGPREFHDKFRYDKGKRSTFDKVVAAAQLLKKHKVSFNTLTCVNSVTSKHAFEIYHFLVDELGSKSLQFIPIVEPKSFHNTAPQFWPADFQPIHGSSASRPGTADSVVLDWSVDPDDWGQFLIEIFDEWEKHGKGEIFVNWIETMVSWRLGLGSQMCVTNDFCGKNLAIEHDGQIFSCDHYVYPEYQIGNILDGNLGEKVFSRDQVKFGWNKKDSLSDYCKKCVHLEDCFGGCPKDRFTRTPDGQPGLHYLCRGFVKYYNHTSRKMDLLALEIQKNRPRS